MSRPSQKENAAAGAASPAPPVTPTPPSKITAKAAAAEHAAAENARAENAAGAATKNAAAIAANTAADGCASAAAGSSKKEDPGNNGERSRSPSSSDSRGRSSSVKREESSSSSSENCNSSSNEAVDGGSSESRDSSSRSSLPCSSSSERGPEETDARRCSRKRESEESSSMTACEGCGATVKPVLSCPSCVKLGIRNSYFCKQECFKASWKKHREVHAVMQQLLAQRGERGGAAADAEGGLKAAAAVQLQDQQRQPIDWSKPFDASDPSSWQGDPSLPNFLNFRFTGPLRPWRMRQSRRRIPPGVATPDYAYTGTPYAEEAERRRPVKIHVHTEEEIERVRAACALGREALDYAHGLVRPGVTTEEIDEKLHEFIVSRGAYPSPLNYCGFPKSCCTSVNEVICHGIPDMRPLEKGDLLNIDVTVYFRGMHGDLNETYVVGGETDEDSKRLLQGAYLCLAEAIKRCRPGVMYRHVGQFVSEVADKYKLSVVRSYCGHGIGALFHTKPNVPHYAHNKAPATMKPGHIFTIEPMLNLGKWNDVLWPDKWTACTADGKRSAQFEHTLLVTKDGVEILTQRRKASPPLDCDTMGFDFP